MSHPQPPRLTVVQTHPIQYFAPLYRELVRHGLQTRAIYLTDAGSRRHFDKAFQAEIQWNLDLLGGYDSEILMPGKNTTQASFLSRDGPRLLRRVAQSRPDYVLVHGYASLMSWRVALWAKARGVRVCYFSDSNGRLEKSLNVSGPRDRVIQAFFKLVDLVICPSDANRVFLTKFGVPPGVIHEIPFSIESSRFGQAERRVTYDFVWAGKMLDWKRPLDLPMAIAGITGAKEDVSALMIGSGPELPHVRHFVEQNRLRISLPGFVNQAEMPEALKKGETFVFTSEADPYGLAVTEAAACGLPIVAAGVNGCVGRHGSAKPGRNALTYTAGNIAELQQQLLRVLSDESLRRRFSANSLIVGEEHSSQAAAAALSQVLLEDYRRGHR